MYHNSTFLLVVLIGALSGCTSRPEPSLTDIGSPLPRESLVKTAAFSGATNRNVRIAELTCLETHDDRKGQVNLDVVRINDIEVWREEWDASDDHDEVYVNVAETRFQGRFPIKIIPSVMPPRNENDDYFPFGQFDRMRGAFPTRHKNTVTPYLFNGALSQNERLVLHVAVMEQEWGTHAVIGALSVVYESGNWTIKPSHKDNLHGSSVTLVYQKGSEWRFRLKEKDKGIYEIVIRCN